MAAVEFAPPPPPQWQAPPPGPYAPHTVAPPRKSHVGLVIGIIFVLMVIAGGIAGGWYYWTNYTRVTAEQTTADCVTGQSVELSALETGKEVGITWALVETSAAGTVTPTTSEKTGAGIRYKATYTAPPTPGTYHVRVYPRGQSNKARLIEIHVTARAPGSFSQNEVFISQSLFENNWITSWKTSAPAISVSGGVLTVGGDPACTAGSEQPAVLYRSKGSFFGDFDVSLTMKQSGVGQGSFGLWSTWSNAGDVWMTLENRSDGSSILTMRSGDNTAGDQVSGGIYTDHWSNLRIQVQQGMVNFYAEGTLLQSFPLPATATPDSYFVVFGASSECGSATPGQTSVNLIRITG